MRTFTHTWEQVDGYRYPQPVERLDGKRWAECCPEDQARWGTHYWQQYTRDEARRLSLYDSEAWRNNAIRNYAYDEIYKYLASGKEPGSYSALLPFEVCLLNDGYLFESMGGLNALSPGRSYVKDGHRVSLGFGYKRIGAGGIVEREVKFYFVIRGRYYQVSNKPEEYGKAIKGQLPCLDNEL